MPEEPYKPIACGDYDIYEIAIMKHRQLRLEWQDVEGELCKQTVTPLALKIIEGAEYLLYEISNTGDKHSNQKIRLDKINSAELC